MTNSQLPYKDGNDSCQFNLLHKNVDTDWNTCIQAIRVLRDLHDLRARRKPMRMTYKVHDTYVLGFSACHCNVLTRNITHRSTLIFVYTVIYAFKRFSNTHCPSTTHLCNLMVSSSSMGVCEMKIRLNPLQHSQ